MKWFGQAPWALICDDCERALVPVGVLCSWCHEPIEPGDDGVMMEHALGAGEFEERPRHYECNMRSIIGGLNHLRGLCTCCGGTEPPDPPELTRHEAAIAAVVFKETRA